MVNKHKMAKTNLEKKKEENELFYDRDKESRNYT